MSDMQEEFKPIIQGWQVVRGDDALSVTRGDFVPIDIASIFPSKEVAKIFADEFGIEIGGDTHIMQYEF